MVAWWCIVTSYLQAPCFYSEWFNPEFGLGYAHVLLVCLVSSNLPPKKHASKWTDYAKVMNEICKSPN